MTETTKKVESSTPAVTVDGLVRMYREVKALNLDTESIYVSQDELTGLLRFQVETPFSALVPSPALVGRSLVVDPIRRIEQRERWRRDAVRRAFIAWFNLRFPLRMAR